MVKNVKKQLGVIAILMVIFIDGLGSSMVLPLLPDLFPYSGNELAPFKNLASNPDWYYSFTLAIFPIAMFFGAPSLGRIADLIGKKVTIGYCLLGTCLGYLICAIGIELGSAWLYIFGRLLDGITAGSLPVAQAFLIASRTESSKQANIGLALFFASSGYTIGPIIGGYLSNLLPYLTIATLPHYFVALLSIVAFFILLVVKEDEKETIHTIEKKSTLSDLIPNVRGKGFFPLIFIFSLYQLAWTGFFQYFSKYLSVELGCSSNEIAVLLSSMGLGMGFSF